MATGGLEQSKTGQRITRGRFGRGLFAGARARSENLRADHDIDFENFGMIRADRGAGDVIRSLVTL